MDYDMTNPYEIAKYIKEAKKATPVKVYVKGDLSGASAEGVKVFGQGDFWIDHLFFTHITNPLLIMYILVHMYIQGYKPIIT